MHKYKTDTGTRERATSYCCSIQCVKIVKEFSKVEKKLEDHKTFHAMFKMDDSEKIYMYEGILE